CDDKLSLNGSAYPEDAVGPIQTKPDTSQAGREESQYRMKERTTLTTSFALIALLLILGCSEAWNSHRNKMLKHEFLEDDVMWPLISPSSYRRLAEQKMMEKRGPETLMELD
ncbi:hypothetical protein CSKR_203290, partial [Clonorchis sinensis]